MAKPKSTPKPKGKKVTAKLFGQSVKVTENAEDILGDVPPRDLEGKLTVQENIRKNLSKSSPKELNNFIEAMRRVVVETRGDAADPAVEPYTSALRGLPVDKREAIFAAAKGDGDSLRAFFLGEGDGEALPEVPADARRLRAPTPEQLAAAEQANQLIQTYRTEAEIYRQYVTSAAQSGDTSANVRSPDEYWQTGRAKKLEQQIQDLVLENDIEDLVQDRGLAQMPVEDQPMSSGYQPSARSEYPLEQRVSSHMGFKTYKNLALPEERANRRDLGVARRTRKEVAEIEELAEGSADPKKRQKLIKQIQGDLKAIDTDWKSVRKDAAGRSREQYRSALEKRLALLQAAPDGQPGAQVFPTLPPVIAERTGRTELMESLDAQKKDKGKTISRVQKQLAQMGERQQPTGPIQTKDGTLRLIVAGGRNYSDYEATKAAVQKAVESSGHDGPVVIISGGATGADKLGEKVAKELGYGVEVYKADWAGQGRKAGPLRNKQMAEVADALVAMPGGRGTEDMMGQMYSAKKPVFVGGTDDPVLPAPEPQKPAAKETPRTRAIQSVAQLAVRRSQPEQVKARLQSQLEYLDEPLPPTASPEERAARRSLVAELQESLRYAQGAYMPFADRPEAIAARNQLSSAREQAVAQLEAELANAPADDATPQVKNEFLTRIEKLKNDIRVARQRYMPVRDAEAVEALRPSPELAAADAQTLARRDENIVAKLQERLAELEEHQARIDDAEQFQTSLLGYRQRGIPITQGTDVRDTRGVAMAEMRPQAEKLRESLYSRAYGLKGPAEYDEPLNLDAIFPAWRGSFVRREGSELVRRSPDAEFLATSILPNHLLINDPEMFQRLIPHLEHAIEVRSMEDVPQNYTRALRSMGQQFDPNPDYLKVLQERARALGGTGELPPKREALPASSAPQESWTADLSPGGQNMPTDVPAGGLRALLEEQQGQPQTVQPQPSAQAPVAPSWMDEVDDPALPGAGDLGFIQQPALPGPYGRPSLQNRLLASLMG